MEELQGRRIYSVVHIDVVHIDVQHGLIGFSVAFVVCEPNDAVFRLPSCQRKNVSETMASFSKGFPPTAASVRNRAAQISIPYEISHVVDRGIELLMIDLRIGRAPGHGVHSPRQVVV